MKLCFFGMYNKHYARTSTLREGLRRLGVEVNEIQEEIPNERMELPEDFTLQKVIHRIWRKVFCLMRLSIRSHRICVSDAIIVLHPGHMELPLAFLVAKIARKPLLFDSSISPYDTMFVGRSIAKRTSWKANLVKCIESFLLKLPDKIFVDTDGMGKFLKQELHISEKKLFTVPLGANNAIYKPSQNKTRRSDRIQVLFFGLYNPMHGAPTILEAARLLKNQDHIVFIMLGDGYLKEDFISYATKHNLNNVQFIRFVPERELVTHIQNADILLGVFSKSPVFERVIPNKVFAAVACKKPLITADRPEVARMFENGREIMLCPPEDPQSLAQAILVLSQSEKRREAIALAGYQKYTEVGTPEAIAKTFLLKGLGVMV
ncbi:MAG: glycosyltransferase family 4 protein [Patescibacteria group bacterium]|nr:glycosyltransferase family 4 protein [Patescibacteria group bacterium]